MVNNNADYLLLSSASKKNPKLNSFGNTQPIKLPITAQIYAITIDSALSVKVLKDAIE